MRLLALIAASLLSACGRSGTRVSAGAFEGLGFRTALIVISPKRQDALNLAQQYEIVSRMSFIDKVFDVGTLRLADKHVQPPPFTTDLRMRTFSPNLGGSGRSLLPQTRPIAGNDPG